MKKNASYEINFATNTITVSRRFLRAANQMGTDEFNTMSKLRELNMPIAVRSVSRSRSRGAKQWSYAQIERFLLQVADSERYLADFRTMRKAFPYPQVWAWFRSTFPNYAAVPELDEAHRIVVLPADAPKGPSALDPAA